MQRIPPHDLDAEMALLGSIFVDPGILDQPWAELEPDAFYKEAHRHIWRAIQEVYRSGASPDYLLVKERLEAARQLEAVGGITYLIGLYEHSPTSLHAEHYASIVRNKYALRRLISMSGEVMRRAFEEEGSPEDIFASLDSDLTRFASGNRVRGPMDYFREAEAILSGNTGALTGFYDMDRLTGGLAVGLNIFAGRPSMGKTSLVRQIAHHFAYRGEGVFYASYDQAGSQIYLLEAAVRSGVSLTDLRGGRATPQDEMAFRQALADIRDLWGAKVQLIDLPAPLERLVSQARAAVRKGASLVIVDYLQLVEAKGEGEVERISRVSKAMKGLALECGVPIIGVSQLSRQVESRPDKRPLLSDLRQSGQLEQDADQVWMLYRDEYYNPASKDRGIAEILLRKQKTGPTGLVKLTWNDALAEFRNLAHLPGVSSSPASGGKR